MTSKSKITSLYKRTKEQLELRKSFFNKNAFKNEIGLASKLRSMIYNQEKGGTFISLSEFVPHLLDLSNKELLCVDTPFEKSSFPQLILEPSSGESTPCNSEDEAEFKQHKLSFTEACQKIIDCSLIVIDQMEPMRVEKFLKLPKEWEGVKEIILVGLDEEFAKDKQYIQDLFEKQFYQFKFVKFKKIRIIYYKAKLSAIIKFDDENSTQFVYFNIHQKINIFKKDLGPDLEIYRVIENKTRNPPKQSWIAVIIRHLPLKIQKEDLEQFISLKLTPTYLEDIVQYDKLKYALVKVENMESAEQLIKYIDETSKLRNIKPNMSANLHPFSSKRYGNQQSSIYKDFFIQDQENSLMNEDLISIRNKQEQLEKEEKKKKEEIENQRIKLEEMQQYINHEKIKLENDFQQKKMLDLEQKQKQEEQTKQKIRQNIYELQKNKMQEKIKEKRNFISASQSPKIKQNNIKTEKLDYEKDYSMNSEEGEYIESSNNLETLKHETLTQNTQSPYSREQKSDIKRYKSERNYSPDFEKEIQRYDNNKYQQKQRQYYKENRHYRGYNDNNRNQQNNQQPKKYYNNNGYNGNYNNKLNNNYNKNYNNYNNNNYNNRNHDRGKYIQYEDRFDRKRSRSTHRSRSREYDGDRYSNGRDGDRYSNGRDSWGKDMHSSRQQKKK